LLCERFTSSAWTVGTVPVNPKERGVSKNPLPNQPPVLGKASGTPKHKKLKNYMIKEARDMVRADTLDRRPQPRVVIGSFLPLWMLSPSGMSERLTLERPLVVQLLS